MTVAATPSRSGRRKAALKALAARQAAAAAKGRQMTYSQSQIARHLGLTRSRIEQLETAAKLRFLQCLVRLYPESFLELGGTYDQVAFMESITVTAANARRLWRRWCRITEQDPDAEKGFADHDIESLFRE
jgi:hypothetical protein